MSIISHRRRRSAAHPPWCHIPRCQSDYARLGEHRSAPWTVRPGLVVTLSQRVGDVSPRLETRVVTRLRASAVDAPDTPGQRHALALTAALLRVLTALARHDHCGHNGSFTTSTTPGEA
jgi:hypothetical protein